MGNKRFTMSIRTIALVIIMWVDMLDIRKVCARVFVCKRANARAFVQLDWLLVWSSASRLGFQMVALW